MTRFRSLRVRLTVLYAGLFCAALVVVAVLVQTSFSATARRQVEGELTASGAVFDRLWAMKASQLADGAAVLSRDFGFREALATQDGATVASALENLKQRLSLDGAFILGADASVTGAVLDETAAGDLWQALDQGRMSGVLMVGGAPHQAVAEPIMAPQLIGWVVFTERMDRAELKRLEGLSAIPLTAAVEIGDKAAGQGNRVSTRKGPAGEALELIKPLTVLSGGEQAALVLRYPLKQALAPYNALLMVLALVGLAGLAGLIVGSWFLARSITRPVSALDAATQRLRDGEASLVEVATEDELGRLAESFNAMVLGIREREDRITTLARTDQETGIANRRVLEAAVAEADPGRAMVAAIGIERFMQVRAAVGYPMAAAMVRGLAARIGDLLPGAVCARLSSERLGLLFEADEGPALARMEALVQALSRPIQIEGVTIDIAVTAGLAAVGDDHPAPPVERASIALDQARAARQAVKTFDAEAYGDPSSKLSLMSEMLAAMQAGELYLAYQPKHDFRAQAVTGVEALVRWRHPVRGFVPPDLFVGLAEETGHIRALTRWTIIRAVEDQARLRAEGHDLLFSVNLSGRMVSDMDFAEEVAALVAEHGARLCLELTETAVIDNPERALEAIDRLRAAGIGVSIDDYGSGLSSLAYLKQIHADELKIDRAFIQSLDQDARDALLVKSTIDLAHSLGMKVVAEGIETPAVLAALGAMGCDMGQGYFISRPIPLADLTAFLAAPADAPSRKTA